MNRLKEIAVSIIGFILLIVGGVQGQTIVDEDAKPQKVTDGYEFTEGPVWHESGYLLFSDIPANIVYKWMPGGEAEEFLTPSGHSNGLAFDTDGTLLLAQHDGAIAQLSENMKLAPVVDSFEGKRLNSPNDLAVKSDGAIYFTDPDFGVSDDDKELKMNGVYRYLEDEGLSLLTDSFDLPNGIVFSPDESRLYVNDTQHNHIRVFDVKSDGSITNGRMFAEMKSDAGGAADGMKVDAEGNLYSTGPGGLWIFSPEGEVIQQVEMPERITNLAWGGSDFSTLFLTAPNAVYQLKTNKNGVQ